MASLNILLALLSIYVRSVYTYIDFGAATLPLATAHIPTIPHRWHPQDQTAHIAGTAMITAIAPSLSVLQNGVLETYYSMHFQNQVPRDGVGKGVFKRGVFADDPPFPTCEACDANGNALNPYTRASSVGATGAPSCSIIPPAIYGVWSKMMILRPRG